jgi:hypothetical protein
MANEREVSIGRRLSGSKDYADIFTLVKESVRSTMGENRTGLSLGLAYLPSHIGAFHQLGSNFIVMNKRLLEKVVETKDQSLINSYVFHVLLHEYIHSLGHVEEQETQALAYIVSEKVLGDGHVATKIAKYGLGALFMQLKGTSDLVEYEPTKDEMGNLGRIEIEDIERDNLGYFG